MAPTVEEEEETHALTHAPAPVLGRALGRVRVLGLDRGLGPRGTAGGAILMNLRGTVDTVEGVEVGLGPVEGVEGAPDVAGTVKALGLVRPLAGVLDPRADGRQATNVAGTEGAGRDLPRTLCVLVAHGRDLTLVLVPVLHALARGRALCLTLPTRGTVGAGAGAARVLDPSAVEGGATAKTTFETAVVGRGHRGSS